MDGFSISRGLAFNIQQNFELPLSIKVGGTYLDVYSVDDNITREDELFVPSFTGVFSLSYNWDKINTSIDWTAKVIGPMSLPTFLICLKEQKNLLGFLNTICKSKRCLMKD